MDSLEDFTRFVRRIQQLGYSEEDAARYAQLIGDRPILDEHGKTLVIDETGTVIAKLSIPWGGE